jgi:hypothetical protein
MAWTRRRFIGAGAGAIGLAALWKYCVPQGQAEQRLRLLFGGGICFVKTPAATRLDAAMLAAHDHEPILSVWREHVKRVSGSLKELPPWKDLKGQHWRCWSLDSASVRFAHGQPGSTSTSIRGPIQGQCPPSPTQAGAWDSFDWIADLRQIAPEFRPNTNWEKLSSLRTKIALTGGEIKGHTPSAPMHCIWEFPAPDGIDQNAFRRAMTDVALFTTEPSNQLSFEFRGLNDESSAPAKGSIDLHLPAVATITYLPTTHGKAVPPDTMPHFAMFRDFLVNCYDPNRLIPKTEKACDPRITSAMLRHNRPKLDYGALAKNMLLNELNAMGDHPSKRLLGLQRTIEASLRDFFEVMINESGHCAGPSISMD